MKRKARILGKSVLAFALSLSMAVTPLAGTGLTVFADEVGGVNNGEGVNALPQEDGTDDQAGTDTLSPDSIAPADQGIMTISGEGVYYEQNFEGKTLADLALSGMHSDRAKIQTVEGNSYLAQAHKENGDRVVALDFKTSEGVALDLSATEQYIVEFDTNIVAASKNPSYIAVKSSDITVDTWGGITGGYLFLWKNEAANSQDFTINGNGNKITAAKDLWIHCKVYVDKSKQKASVTITNKSSNVVLADKVITAYNGNGNATGLYLAAGKTAYDTSVNVDNVVVRAPGEGDEFGDVSEAAVSYNIQGHGTAIDDKQCIVGGPAEEPAAPRETGYVFLGWYKEAECTTAWNFSTDTVPAEGVTLFAKWIADPAETYEDALYAQTFSSVTDIASVGITSHGSDEIGKRIMADAVHGYYFSYEIAASATGNRWVNMDFASAADVSGKSNYTVEFDAAITPGNDAGKTSTFSVNTSDGYLISLATNGRTGTYKIAGTDPEETITIPVGQWCHYLLEVNKQKTSVVLTVTQGETVIVDKKSIAFSGSGNVSGLKMDQGRYPSLFCLDNIVIKAAEAPQPPAGGTDYYVTMENINAAETVVDCSSLINNEKVVKYRVTTAKNGKLVKQEFVAPAASVTADTTGADKVEVTPVFHYNMGAPGEKGTGGYKIEMPAGTYDFRVINTSGERCDVYVDDQMLVNNILQNGATPNYFDVKDIVTSGDEITFSTADSKADASAMKIEIYMVPSSGIMDRVQKVYVLGDSLVAMYYNGGSPENKDAQTGWGQVLADYLTGDVEVIDLANSGATAYVLESTAFTQVQGSAQSGDILLLESGYNDATTTKEGYFDNGGTDNYMAVAVKKMVSAAQSKGMTVILISPNASLKPYRGTPAWTTRMEEVVDELNAGGQNVGYIDLAQLSYDFLSATYGAAAADAADAMKEDYVVSDELHSKYNAAQKYASLVAGELYKLDATKAIVDADFAYAYVDSKGNVISCSATGKQAEGYAKVTFSANMEGGTDTFKVVATGSKLTAPADPTASGFVFEGWYKEAACTTAWNFETDTVAADTILYAKWTQLAAGTIYTQNFSKVTDASTVATSKNAQAQLKIAEDAGHGKYLTYDFAAVSTNSRGADMNFDGADVSGKDKYIVEFDAAIKPGDNQATYFTVKGTDFKYLSNNIDWGADSGYILNLVNAGGGATKYTMNKTKEVTIPSGEWCHYKLYVDKTQKLVSTTITGSATGSSIADKVVTSYDGAGNVAGLYMLAGRYKPVMSLDNILVREVAEDVDEFGELEQETLHSAEFTAQLSTVIREPGVGTPVHKALTIKANGSLGGDLTDKVSVAWSVVGLENEDGYISLTQAQGTGSGTEGPKANVADYTGTTAYFNVRNGVSNYYGYVKAVVTYGDKSVTITTPFAVICSAINVNQLAPAAGYPVSMNDYADSLVGYVGTSQGIDTKDLILNNWSIYGSNGARSMKLVKDADGTKALEFASNGGGGSTVAVYQWTDQTEQYVIDFTAKFTGDMAFGVYANTPNNSGANPEWSASCSADSLSFGGETINGLSLNEWYRFVISADPSVQKTAIKVYKGDTFKGSMSNVDMENNGSVQKYFCFMGSWPMYLSSFRAYKPVLGTITVQSDKDTAKVPEAGEAAATVDLAAFLRSTDDLEMTGAVEWSLAEEYANVEIESTGARMARLTISAGAAPGAVTVYATKDGKQAEKEINLTTSSDAVAFKKSTSSITIPFADEQALTFDYTAETRDKDGQTIDGGAITYTLLAKDGVSPAGTIRGVTFENGVLTVQPGAAPAVVYVKATNAGGLSAKVKVNIHGLSFAFGSQDAAEGYTQVTDTVYTDRLGYGFGTSGLTVNTDSVTAQSAFRFKAKVPNGNYTVMLNTTAASVTSEVVEKVEAATGINKTGTTFNVAVCDGVLDLTFPAGASVKTVEITQMAAKTARSKPYILVIGDSTAKNTANGARSWGNCATDRLVKLPEVFGGFDNHGWGGKNSLSYYNEGAVEGVLLAICPGDYVTVNMGINSEAGEPAAYYTLMKEYYVQGIIQRGGIPVIVTATPDGPVGDRLGTNYNSATGQFTNSRGDGAQNSNMRRIASELNVTLIELGQWAEDWMNTLTMEDVEAYNAAYLTNYKTVLELVQSWYVDHNHYKEYLGKQIAWYLFSRLAEMAGGTAPERPTLPKPQGGRIVEDFETITDWQLEGTLAEKFSVQSDGKGGHYLLGSGAEVGTGNAYAKKVFADLPDMATAEISLDWIANSGEFKTQDKQAYFALQVWSGELELASLYVSDLRSNAAAKVYYSTTGIGDKVDTGVTLKQGQTLKVRFALNFQTHKLDIYLNDVKAVSDVSFNVLATKADTFALATLDDTAAKKKYPNFAIDNFLLVYKEGTAQDLSKLVKSVKPMAKREHSLVSDVSEFVHPTKATVVLGNDEELEVDIDGTTWTVDRTVDLAEVGTYTWKADIILPEGYSNPNGEKASYVMKYLASYLNTDINSLDAMPVVTLTKAEYEAGYSHPAKVMAKLVSGIKTYVDVDPDTWTCAPAFDKNVRGIYTWTAQLADNGTNGNPRNLQVSYTMHYQADWVSTHDIEEDFLFGYPGWDVWGKDIDATSGTGGFGLQIRKEGDNTYLYATQGDGGKNRGSRMNLSADIVKGATMEFDFMPAVVNGGHVDLLFVAPAYKQNYLSLFVGADGKVSYHTTEDLAGSGGHPANNTFEGVISSGSPVATGVGAMNKWMHAKLKFDYLEHKASLTFTSKEDPTQTYTVSDIPIDDRANGLSIMVLRKPSGCSRAEVAFDNVIVDYEKFSASDIVKVTQPKDVNVAENMFDQFALPTEVEATLGDNSKVMVPVGEWQSSPAFVRGTPGTYVWTAAIRNEELGLTNHFGLSLSFTMTYTLLPFPVYVYNPNTVELTYGQEMPAFPARVDAKMSNGVTAEVKVDEWKPIRAFDAEKEGMYVYGANIVAEEGVYDFVREKLSPNENDTDKMDDYAEYVKYDVFYRISYRKDDVNNYNGYARTMENLNRGVYAVAVNGGVFVSWRLLGTEYGEDISFDVYRNGVKVNSAPITDKTNFVDAQGKTGDNYTVIKTQDGLTYEGAEAKASSSGYLSIPVQKPEPQPDKEGNLIAYTLNDMGVADVDGDGEYEYIVKWYPDDAFDSGNPGGPSAPTIFDLYELDGTALWRLNLGLELPSGAHFNQFMLYDMDEDGKAELFIKTSDGTVSYVPNAEGRFDMSDSNTIADRVGDGAVEPGTNVDSSGHVNPNSNEYVTVFNGRTGKIIDSVKFVNPTNSYEDWWNPGRTDNGNRSARYNIAVAYLPKDKDDANCTETIPAVLLNRGYYARTTVAAYTLRNGKLQLEWNFVAPKGDEWSGKGNHNMSTGDIDKDGFDELVIGALALDHDGTVLWVKDGKEGQDYAGHADAIHLAAMNPNSNDLYVFTPNEEADFATMNAAVVNARTGDRVSGVWFSIKDVGRAVAANITPRPGYEYWSAATGSGIYAFDGSTVADTIPVPMNWRMYWDGDLLSELGDGAGIDDDWLITKYNWENNTLDTLATLEGTKTNNHSKKTPALTADLFGDWREEVILRNEDDTELRIYMTTEETEYMIYTLMHDPVYRNAVANQNTAYNQPPQVGFYLGEDNRDTVLAMGLPTANIKYAAGTDEEKVTIAEARDAVPEPSAEVQRETGCRNAAELVTFLRNKVISGIQSAVNVTIPSQNTLIQEIVIRVSFDGGVSYQDATPENFPKEGVKVILPYPEGTNRTEYNFSVSHLITMNCNGLKAGQVVNETVNKTENGLEMIVKSASPFAIGWYRISDAGRPGQGDDGNGDEDSDFVETSDDKISTPAKTGDHMGTLVWVCVVLILAAAGVAAVLIIRRRREDKTSQGK